MQQLEADIASTRSAITSGWNKVHAIEARLGRREGFIADQTGEIQKLTRNFAQVEIEVSNRTGDVDVKVTVVLPPNFLLEPNVDDQVDNISAAIRREQLRIFEDEDKLEGECQSIMGLKRTLANYQEQLYQLLIKQRQRVKPGK